MTAQEKWMTTIRCMELVRANYHLLRGDGAYRTGDLRRRRRLRALEKWMEAIDKAYGELRMRRGKSQARARHDWLVARAIELMVFDNAGGEALRTHLSGPRPLNQRYVDGIAEAAVKAVEKAAEEAGLLRGR